MEITLRKAANLAEKLLETARSLPMSNIVTVTIYSKSTVAQEAEAASLKFYANMKKATALITAAYDIRSSIGVVNASSGIDTMLTEKACLDAIEKINQVNHSNVSSDYEVEHYRLIAMSERSLAGTERYGREESVTVSITPDPEVQKQLIDIRRRKIAIVDELLVLNMTKKITLSAETVSLLTEFNLV